MSSAHPAATIDAINATLRDAAARCGVTMFEDAYGTQSRIDGAPDGAGAGPASLESGAMALLPGHAILTLSGEDTFRFLHSQTTNDVENQAPGEARWHGYCSPKGRLLATMLAWRDDSSMRLLLPDSVADPIRRRLAMFVLRAKVRIADERGQLVALGLAGTRVPDALGALALPAPAPFAVSIAALGDECATIVGLPAIGGQADGEAALPRWLLIVPVSALASTWSRLADSLEPVPSATWRWTVVRAGIAPIVAATSEQFLPQMLNLEALGGVSFTKGCYPGQEVVARTHYLGKQKRRTFLGHLADAIEPPPGSDVCAGNEQPVGKVVAAAPSPRGGVDLLFESQVAAAHSMPLQVGASTLQILPLPYALASA